MRANNTSPRKRSVNIKGTLFVWDNPGMVFDRNGRPVDTTENVWWLQDTSGSNLNWNTLKTSRDIKDAIRCYSAHTVESYAPRTAHQVFHQLKYCFARLPSFRSAYEITYEAIEGAIAIARTKGKDWHFHYIRKWYQWCDDQGISGFSGAIASRLYRLKVTCNAHGHNVMSLDTTNGPLSSDEHFALQRAVKEEKGYLNHRVIIMLLLETGARPIQLVQLEEQDLRVDSSSSGHVFYSLNIPRAKQRKVGEPDKKRRRISPTLGDSIQELIRQNHLNYGDGGPLMPLLCVKHVNLKKLTKELENRYRLHMKVSGCYLRIRSYPTLVEIISPRTGKTLRLCPQRLRYTFFTRLAEQGASTNHLAELADHADNKTIVVYVSSTSSVVDRLNLALGKDSHYAGTMRRFVGEILPRAGNEDKAAVIVGSTPTLKNLGGIGICGADFLCDLYPPLSCYVCPKFQAWVDGPHQKLLKELESFVQSLVEKAANQSDRIPYQLVEVIVALRQLLTRIEVMKNGEEGSET